MSNMIPFGGDVSLTMSSREIAELVESRHDSVKRTMDRLLQQRVISFTPAVETSHEGAGARPVEVYLVNKRNSLIVVAQLCPEFTARIVDRWQELEEQVAHPALPQTMVEALRLAADEMEKREAVERERDHAIATKAQIGSRREASAMATASAAKREAAQLKIELDRSKQFASVKRMQAIHPGKKFNFRELKKAAKELGVVPIKIPDANYGEVNSYHAEIWRKAYSIEIEEVEHA